MRRALLVIAGACGGKHPAPPVVISNAAPPPDAAVPDATDEACDAPAEAPMTVGGVPGNVSLVTCTTGESSASDMAREQGFIQYDRVARLALTANGKTITSQIHAWTSGWEWGSSVVLEGVLVAPNGDGIALIHIGSSAASPGLIGEHAQLIAYKPDGGDWTTHDVASAATLTITWSPDHRTATIDGCESDEGSAAPGCSYASAAKPITTLDATYDGTQVSTQPHP